MILGLDAIKNHSWIQFFLLGCSFTLKKFDKPSLWLGLHCIVLLPLGEVMTIPRRCPWHCFDPLWFLPDSAVSDN